MHEHPITRAASGKPFRCMLVKAGDYCIVDSKDYEALTARNWRNLNGYVCRGVSGGSSLKGFKVKTLYMHRLVAQRMGLAIDGLSVDHWNRVRWDNRRCNLRAATPSEQSLNTSRSGRPAVEHDPIDPAQLALAVAIARDLATPRFGPIPLTKGLVAHVSEEDFDFVMQWKWTGCIHYAHRKQWKPDRSKKYTVYMHIEIGKRMGLEGGKIDHRDGDVLNNRRGNLRLATASQNAANCKKKSHATGPYKGITFNAGRWVAQIQSQKKHYYLGRFDTPEEAHEAYKKAALELHGEFARFE